MMKKIILTILFCAIVTGAFAQKHEVRLAGFMGEYYFDNTGYALRGLSLDKPFIYLGYTHQIKNNNYAVLKIQFRPFGNISYKAIGRKQTFEDDDIEIRGYGNISIGLRKTVFSTLKFAIQPEILVVLRNGRESYLEYTFGWERMYGTNYYSNNIGVALGNSFVYHIAPKINLTGELQYTHFFNQYSPNQILTTLSIGYRFDSFKLPKRKK